MACLSILSVWSISCSFSHLLNYVKFHLLHWNTAGLWLGCFRVILWLVEWNNSFSWVTVEGENRGEKQGWLNAPHFAKCSSGQYITRKWTDRLRKRTERHQWSIVCSQGAPSNSSGSQYIKETKIYYTICTEMFYKYKLRHLCFSLA